MLYTTGSRDDWDNIGRITEDPAWTWDAMGPNRDRNQKYVPPSDGHDDVSRKQLSSFLHSYHSSQINQYLPPAQSKWDTVYQSSGVPAAHRSKSHRDPEQTGLFDRVSLPMDVNTGNTVRFITIPFSRFVLICFRFLKQSWIKGTVGGGKHCSSTLPTLDRNASIARTYTSCSTPMSRNFLKNRLRR